MCSNIDTTFNGGLKGAFHRQLACEITPESLYRNRLLPL